MKSPLTRSSYVRKYSNLRTEPVLGEIEEEEEEERFRGEERFRTPLQGRSRMYEGSPQGRVDITQESVRLPRLVRGGRKEESGKIKDNVKRMMNESDVSLESVNSEEALSGEFIEV
jgi:hypothetical protein